MPADAATEREAIAALPGLSRALSYGSSLRARTEGLTWALWGLVFALVFFMYGGASGEAGGGLWFEVLWIPWVLVGGALTWALWRTAALRLGGDGRRPAGVAVTAAWLGAIAVGFTVALFALPNSESTALLAVGLAWLAMGGTNPIRELALRLRLVVRGTRLKPRDDESPRPLPAPWAGWSCPRQYSSCRTPPHTRAAPR